MLLLFVLTLVLESLIFDIFLYLSFQTRTCNIRCQKDLQNSIENLFWNSHICVGKTTYIKNKDSNNNVNVYLLMINIHKIMSSFILWQVHRIGINKDNFQHLNGTFQR